MPDDTPNQQSPDTGNRPVDLRERGSELSDPRVLLPEWLRDRLPQVVSPSPMNPTTPGPAQEASVRASSEPAPPPPQFVAESRETVSAWPPLPATAVGPIPPAALLAETRLPGWLREISGESAPLPKVIQPIAVFPGSPSEIAPDAELTPPSTNLEQLPPDTTAAAINTPVAVALIVAVFLILILAVWSLYA